MSSRIHPKFIATTTRVLAAGLLAACLMSCDDPPIAPESSMLAISANPSAIGVQGSSVITITLIRTGGRPVDQGTEVLLNASLGTISSVARTDNRGVATAILQATGAEGTATVSASSGTATASTEAAIMRAQLDVSANPPTIRPGRSSTVTIVATYESTGQPVAAGTEILMTTTRGSIPEIVTTDGRGVARASFQAPLTTGTARVTARLGAATASVTIQISSS